MAFVEPAAAAAGKKIAKHEVKKKIENKGRKTVEEHYEKKRADAARRGNSVKEYSRNVRRNTQRATGAHIMKGPHSYSVRRSHNLLIAAWIAGTVIIATALYNNPKESPMQVWKRMFAYQMAMVVLSWISLIESLTGWAALFGWLVTASVALNEQENIVKTLANFSNISGPNPTPQPHVGNSGDAKAVEYNSIIPRNANTSVANSQNQGIAPDQNTMSA